MNFLGLLVNKGLLPTKDREIVEAKIAKNRPLGFMRGIAHLDAHQKSIELRFGQWIGAVMLHRILRGDN